MSRKQKTSTGNRTNYIYYTSEGTKIVIHPGEDGVTEADIKLLHELDDAEVDRQRRYDYRVTEHLDAYRDGERDAAEDRNSHLADERYNPEVVLLSGEDDLNYEQKLQQLISAMDCLQPQQRELFEKVYKQGRTYTSIALEEDVSEAAIRNRLKKIHDKLKKFLS